MIACTHARAFCVGLALAYGACPSVASAALDAVGGPGSGPALVPTGQYISALATPGSTFFRLVTGVRPDGNADGAQAVATALSPDGTTLLVLTSGYNTGYLNRNGTPFNYPVLDPTTGQPSSVTTSNAEWVFVFDVSGTKPIQRQHINIPNTYDGIAWKPDGTGFYVSAGVDDRIYVFKASGNPQAPYVPDAPFILLGHDSNQTQPLPSHDGGILKNTRAGQNSHGLLPTGAVVAKVAVSADGTLVAAANFENDSVSLVNASTRQVTSEIPFFAPGQTQAVGEFPYGVAVRSSLVRANGRRESPTAWRVPRGRRALSPPTMRPAAGAPAEIYVSSQRDGQVIGVTTGGRQTVIPVGDGPNALLLSSDQTRLFVSNGNSDSISVIDTGSDGVVMTILLHSHDPYNGANPNSLALSPDNKTLYVTEGGANAVAVVDVTSGQVLGLIPTGWYPNSVSVSTDGKRLFVVNAKSNAGPDPAEGFTTPYGSLTNKTHRNEYDWANEKGGLLVAPVPDAATLKYLTVIVNANNGTYNRHSFPLLQFLSKKIHHVIYITKENRTYDEVLGDLPVGNGNPKLDPFPQPLTPNHHQLSLDYVTFDNFYDSGESSGVGWNWTVQGHTTDFVEKSQSVYYGNANFTGLTYDYQGANRNLDLLLPQTTGTSPSPFTVRATGLLDPSGASSILPGTKDVSATLGDGDLSPNAIGGYIWDEALRKGKTVRNYGEHIDTTFYGLPASFPSIPIVRHPFQHNAPQAPPTKTALAANTDIYFRGFDQAAPDLYRVEEWEREFQGYVTNRNLPALELVTINHDHFGNFGNALEGLRTPQLQMADNDYALGRIVEDVTKSRYAADTAIIVIEDDSQTGPDHVDAHRSLAYVISPYTKRNALVRTTYTTVNVVRTVTDLLGIGHLGMQDANAAPMIDAFTQTPVVAAYTAIIPGALCKPPVSKEFLEGCNNAATPRTRAVAQLHNGAWWAAATQGMDFRTPDAVDANRFNRILWAGLMGS
jgi:YVTN family beta-propeller protein